MKTFLEFVNESQDINKAKLELSNFLKAFGTDNIEPALLCDIGVGTKDAVEKYFAQCEEAYAILKTHKAEAKLTKKFDALKNGYTKKEKEVQGIRTCVKIGEKQESAIKKIAKMTKTLKPFNLETLKYDSHTYFDPMSEDDIRREIAEFNGQVKLRGNMDFFIEFKNGIVNKTYH